MPKINKEEYEVLKGLDDEWKWITRIEEGAMKSFISKPFKNMDFGRSGSWDIKGNENHAIYTTYSDLFHFIQWEDEKPHNIAELIEEYEIENGMRYDFGKIKVVDIDTSKLANIIDQVDEPEVLSQEWIRNNQERKGVHFFVNVTKLQNLLVPKQEEVDQAYKDGYEKGKEYTFYKGYLEGLADKENEPEKVVVPQFVADYIEECKRLNKSGRKTLHSAIHTMPKEVSEWMIFDIEGFGKGQELFARAWLDGYEVEEDPLYYALVKGHELADSYDIYWNCDKSDSSLFISRLHPPHDNFLTEMSKAEWNELGINDSNADFVKVDE